MRIPSQPRRIWSVLAVAVVAMTLMGPVVGVAAASAKPIAPSTGAGTTPSTPKPTPSAVVNIPYGPEAAQLLDVVSPPGASEAPCVILIHGGGFVTGDKDVFVEEGRQLANAGFVVFSVNYTLDPSQPAYPRQVEDVHTALDWIEEHAGEYGGDPTRVSVIGGSSGAYLAAMLGNQANTAESAPVRVMASLSTAMDFVAIADELRAVVKKPNGTCTPIDCDSAKTGSENIKALLGCDPVDCPDDLLREASPISYVTEYSPASFIASSTGENIPPDQATEMAAVLRDNGVETHVELIPGDAHGEAYLPDIAETLLTFITTNDAAAVITTPPPTTTAPVVADEPGDGRRQVPIRWIVVGLVVALLLIVAAIRVAQGRSNTAEGD